MKFAKILLVALALWMPAASFAAALGALPVEQSAPCEGSSSSEEASDRSEDNELFFTKTSLPFSRATIHTVELASHSPLDGNIVEMLIPPPNRA